MAHSRCQVRPWSAAGERIPCKQEPFLGPLKARFLTVWLAHQARGMEKTLCPCRLSEGTGMRVGGAKAFSANFQQLRNGLCLPGCRLWFMSPSGTCLPYSRLPASFLGALNALICTCLLGLLKHNARAHSSLEVTVPSAEVSGS